MARLEGGAAGQPPRMSAAEFLADGRDPDAAVNADGLTEKQVLARIRLRKETARIIEQQREQEARRRHMADAGPEAPGAAGAPEDAAKGDAEDAPLPDIVYGPEDAPEGPPWRYDMTPEQVAARQERKFRRSEQRSKVKNKALEKTPGKLRNPSNLQVRFRTGLVYTLVTIACVLAGNIPTLLYLMLVAGICAGEFYYMLRSDAKLPNEMLGITGAVLFLPATYLWGLTGAMVVAIALLLALLVWYVFWLKARIPDVGVSFFGAAYTGLMLCGLVVVRQSVEAPWGGVVLFLLFLSVWANDAFAYFVGSRFGRHKLAPRTSPKKSWEGFVAGLVGSALVWVVMSFVPAINLSVPLAIVFGVVCGLTEVLGDLAESRIKRNSGFKDSGTIMPGHGGLLDRCDSLFLASTTAAILLVAGGCVNYPFL